MPNIDCDGKKFFSVMGANLYQELTKNKIAIRSSCGGVGACGDCIVKMVDGEKNINPMTVTEKHYLGNVYHLTKERLSCQCVINGDIKIKIE